MPAKGTIKQDIFNTNKYQLTFAGAPPLTVTEVSGLTEKIPTVKLPDRTVVSGGNTDPLELEITLPAHHITEMAYMDSWWQDCQDPVTGGYKRTGTLTALSNQGVSMRSDTLFGVWVTERNVSDRKMEDEGAMVTVKYKLSVDSIKSLTL